MVRVDSLSQYMEKDVYMLQDDATVKDAIAYFLDKNVSGVPVIHKNGSPAGFISDGDIMRYLKPENHPAAIDSSATFMDYLWNPDAEFEEKLNSVMNINVLEIGNIQPITISENASIDDACKLLSEAGV